MHHVAARLRGRCSGDAGAVVVESAIVLPLVLAFLCGTIDMGVAFRDHIQLENALRSAARIAAAGQNVGNTDQLALTSLAASLVGMKNAEVTRIVVYETDATGAMSSGCNTTLASTAVGTKAGNSTTANRFCNIYSRDQMNSAGTSTNFTAANATSCPSVALDSTWCPISRVIALTGDGSAGAGTGPDYLGISVTIAYTPYTRFWGTRFNITDHVVVRLEPSAV